jgi:hypothetical protein
MLAYARLRAKCCRFGFAKMITPSSLMHHFLIFSTVYIIRVVGGAKIAFDLHHSYVAASFLMLIVSPLHLQLVVRIHRLFYRTSSSSALEAIFGYLIYFLQVKLCAFVDCDCRYCAACGCCMCCCCIVLLLFCY